MNRLAERCPPSELPERMDREDQDPELLDRALDALARVNRRLGGTGAVWRPLARALARRPGSGGEVRILDVGAGGGDMGRDLTRRIGALGLRPRLLLGDRRPETLRLARRRGRRADGRGGAPRVRRPTASDRLVGLRADRLPFRTDALDFVVCATTLHHLEWEEARAFLQEAERVSTGGWVVADLRRCWPAYLAVRALALTIWRDNPLPRRDGPRSVRRAFTPEEARRLLDDAGLPRARARAASPFRLQLVGGEAFTS